MSSPEQKKPIEQLTVAEALVPPDVARVMVDMEKELRARVGVVLASNKQYPDELKRIILLYIQLLREHGEWGDVGNFTKDQSFRGSLTAWRKNIDEKDVETLMRQYLDLKRAAAGNGEAPDAADPERAGLEAELAALERQLAGRKGDTVTEDQEGDEAATAPKETITIDGFVVVESDPLTENENEAKSRFRMSKAAREFIKGKDPNRVAARLVKRVEGWSQAAIAASLTGNSHIAPLVRAALEEEYDLPKGIFTEGPIKAGGVIRTLVANTDAAAPGQGEPKQKRKYTKRAKPEANGDTASDDVADDEAVAASAEDELESVVALPAEEVPLPPVPASEVPAEASAPINRTPGALATVEAPSVGQAIAAVQGNTAAAYKLAIAINHEVPEGSTNLQFSTTNPAMAQSLQNLLGAFVASTAEKKTS